MNTNKVPFGLLNGRMVSAEEVPQGLACGCICAGCNGRLVARHPTKGRVKHFAHYRDVVCPGAYETAIHKAAKQLISESPKILVPELTATSSTYNLQYNERAEKTETLLSKVLAIDDIRAECRDYQGIVPDIVATIAGRKVFIEIAVTHPTGADKLEKLKVLGYPAFEISLSKLPEIPSSEELKELVLHSPMNRKWLFNPRQQELEERVKAAAESELQHKINIQKRVLANDEEQRQIYRGLSDNSKLHYDLKAMGLTWEQVSHIVGHEVSCAFSIQSALTTWQLSIFRRFIHNKKPMSSFHKDEVYIWVVERFELYLSDKIRDAPKIAIYHYLQSLINQNLIFKHFEQGMYGVKASK